MRKHLLCLVFAIATAGVASLASAGELTVKIADGRATVIARDVPVRQILAEWARVGNTRVVNGEKLMGGPISIELIDVPEKEALDVLLRTAAGYLAAPRPVNVPGASQYDRVVVLATSRAPVATASSTPASFRPAMQQLPPQPPPDDDDGEPGDQGPMPPPGSPNGPLQPFPGPAIMGPNNPNGPNGPLNNPNGPNGQFPPGQQPTTTSPRPGQLPAPQPQLPNPYIPVGRPGPTAGRPGGESGPGQ